VQWLFESGHAADIVLAVLAAEAVLLRLRGWRVAELAGLLGPAALIVLGLRAALIGTDWYWIALPVALAFPLHLVDLSARSARRE